MTRDELLDRYSSGKRNFTCANLRGANLRDADLSGANLSGANLWGANLWGANLRNAYLWGVNLRDADLRDADLRNANLRNANVAMVRWPSPTIVLLALWGQCSGALTTELMRYDAANHPNPNVFDRWANDDECPYSLCHVQRSANFTEQKSLWSPGLSKSAYELMQMLLAEHCKLDKEVDSE